MIWLASFPRSGNTFLRNILYHVYGLESGSFHQESYDVEPDLFDKYPVIKTHLLPEELPTAYQNHPKVYLVREGRDALTSMAHHRKNFLNPDSDLYQNMTESIIAAEESFFGGWSMNVAQWTRAADIVIRFEELIKNPLEEVEKLRAIYPDLPQPMKEKLPTFETQHSGDSKYGSVHDQFDSFSQTEGYAQKFFRKGEAGQWQQEMPAELQTMYWKLHGQVSEGIGYLESGAIDPAAKRKIEAVPRTGKRVLIAGNKLNDFYIDGTKRYVVSFLKGLHKRNDIWGLPFELSLKRTRIVPIEEYFISEDEGPEESPTGVVGSFLGLPRFFQGLFGTQVYATFLLVLSFFGVRKIFRKISRKIRNEQVKKNPFDLIHYTTPETHKDPRVQALCTLHDVSYRLFPQFHTRENVAFHEEAVKDLLHYDAYFLTVSNYTQREFRESYPDCKNGTKTVYEAVDHERFFPVLNESLKAEILQKYELEEGQYFLSLSTIEPRKNIQAALKAFARFKEKNPDSPLKFVLAGRYGWKSGELATGDDVIRTGYLPEEDINIVMGSAIALCYLSHYEGFGLPPLEAMRCKTVPIYGANSSMIELIGEAGLAVDQDNIEAICEKMESIASDATMRGQMEEAAYQKSWDYTLDRMAAGTLGLYQELIDKPGD